MLNNELSLFHESIELKNLITTKLPLKKKPFVIKPGYLTSLNKLHKDFITHRTGKL